MASKVAVSALAPGPKHTGPCFHQRVHRSDEGFVGTSRQSLEGRWYLGMPHGVLDRCGELHRQPLGR